MGRQRPDMAMKKMPCRTKSADMRQLLPLSPRRSSESLLALSSGAATRQQSENRRGRGGFKKSTPHNKQQ
ncbi:unnamed protein product, partial [Mesorhabditis belari]|uniref:Uncharacterized protein n=1 Tax=Mesorhabditis belari TaxID=2138241 RepID=A0AAF3FIR8_9BILA